MTHDERQMLLHFSGGGPLETTVYRFGAALKSLKRLGYIYERDDEYVLSERGRAACDQMVAKSVDAVLATT